MSLVVAVFPDQRRARAAYDDLRATHAVELHSREAIEELEAPRGRRVPLAAIAGAFIGGGIALGTQWYSATLAYPLDIGGRPAFSPAAWLPATIAVAMFWSALGAMTAFLFAAGLPRLHHPLFDARGHARLSHGATILSVTAAPDEAEALEARLRAAGGEDVERVQP
jgi:hypothetical protein